MNIQTHRLAVVLVLTCTLLGFTPSQAGILGENVAVVVNGDSVDSITIANHYVSMRNIPLSNVIVLDNVPQGVSTSLDAFRDSILKPVLETINTRGIAGQIHVVAYSAGFPTAVKIPEHTKRLTDPAQKKYQTPTASINSLTYFYRYVLSDSADYLGWTSNQYARGRFERHFTNPFGGEKAKQFSNAESSAEAEDYESAATGFEALAREYPTLSPLNILAAKNWLRFGNELKGIEQLKAAVASGWSSRRSFSEVEPFAEYFQPSDDRAIAMRRSRLLESLQDVPIVNQGPMAFSSSVEWTASGHPVPSKSGAVPYMLSCVLAVIGPNAATLSEAIGVLDRAVRADRTYPDATFGFAKTKDIRVTTREPLYPDAIAWLLSRDHDVDIFSNTLPTRRGKYAGMMLGSARLSLGRRVWSFAPGAIAENLTSLGAAFETASQTKLTELLKAGAAISSGAVAEPYSLPVKFPAAMIYPYYCEGVTAIEAFYLSIASPYQMLIVGDPLCQPFARPPNDLVRIRNDSAGDSSQERIQVAWQPFPDAPKSTPVQSLDIYLLGKLVARQRPVTELKINLPANLSGAIDCRVLMIGNDPAKPAIATRKSILVGDPNRAPRIQRLRKDVADELTLYVDCPDTESIDLIHMGRTLSRIEGPSAKVVLSETQVGRGPVRIQAVAKQEQSTAFGEVFETTW